MTTRRADPAPLDVRDVAKDTDALASLYRIAEVVNSDLDHDGVMQAVADEATSLVGAAFGAYFANVEDDAGPAYQLSTLSGGDREAFARFPRPRATPIFGPTFHGEGVLRLDDVTTDPRYGTMPPHHGMPPGHPPVRSYLAVPVRAPSGDVLGGLFFGHPATGVFGEREERLAGVVAWHAALAVEKARRFADEQQARREAEATSVRLALLQTLTAELANAREVAQVATALVASSEVGLGAESTLVYLARRGRLAAVRPHSFRPEVVDRVGSFDVGAPLPVAEAFRTQRTVVCRSVAERDRRWPSLAEVDPGPNRSWAFVPLVTDGAAHGVVVFGWTTPQEFTADDRGFLSAVAHQCALALDRVRLDQSLREDAETLQASLLPPRVRAPHGLEVATRYRPVEKGAQVGGDFYDLFPVAPGRWGVVVGDVSGKGVRAASLTALARHTVRAAARSEPYPSLVLGVLNDELLEAEQDHFCTVAYLEAEPTADGCDVRLALAGHPHPVVRRRDGRQEAVGEPGMAAGLLPMAEVADTDVALGPGDALVLVTDGVVEARDERGRFADDLLGRALADGGDAEALADAVVDTAVGFAGGRPRDDIAVVILRVPERADAPRRVVREVEVPADPASVARARQAAADFCAEHDLDAQADTVVLLTSELVTNVVRHAGTPAGLRLGLHDGRVRVEVTDGSRLRPVRRTFSPEVDAGRGLNLLERLAPDWGVRRIPEGKTVWFELDA